MFAIFGKQSLTRSLYSTLFYGEDNKQKERNTLGHHILKSQLVKRPVACNFFYKYGRGEGYFFVIDATDFLKVICFERTQILNKRCLQR